MLVYTGIGSAAKRSTGQLLRSIPRVPCLKCHEINGKYYARKTIHGKIETYALRSESALPLRTESSPSENCASGRFGTRRRGAFNPAGVSSR